MICKKGILAMFSVKNITMIYDIEKENKMYALGGFDLELASLR